MRYRSLLLSLLALGLVAAGRARADAPELIPHNPPPAPSPVVAPPPANASPAVRLQYWQGKLMLDQQRAVRAQSRKNLAAYNRAEQAIRQDQTRINNLEILIAKRSQNGGGGQIGAIAGQRQALRQLIQAEIAKDQQYLSQLQANQQVGQKLAPGKRQQNQALIRRIRSKLKDDRAMLRSLKGASSASMQSIAQSFPQTSAQFWSEIQSVSSRSAVP